MYIYIISCEFICCISTSYHASLYVLYIWYTVVRYLYIPYTIWMVYCGILSVLVINLPYIVALFQSLLHSYNISWDFICFSYIWMVYCGILSVLIIYLWYISKLWDFVKYLHYLEYFGWCYNLEHPDTLVYFPWFQIPRPTCLILSSSHKPDSYSHDISTVLELNGCINVWLQHLCFFQSLGQVWWYSHCHICPVDVVRFQDIGDDRRPWWINENKAPHTLPCWKKTTYIIKYSFTINTTRKYMCISYIRAV